MSGDAINNDISREKKIFLAREDMALNAIEDYVHDMLSQEIDLPWNRENYENNCPENWLENIGGQYNNLKKEMRYSEKEIGKILYENARDNRLPGFI